VRHHGADQLGHHFLGLLDREAAHRSGRVQHKDQLARHDLCRRDAAGEETAIDPYACESPAEFFAVASEAFFEIPSLLAVEYPDVYQQIRAFYRQDPLARLPRWSG
jgi:Mlc titration factor MtfA (ptsG expression regulator)